MTIHNQDAPQRQLPYHLAYLKLPCIRNHFEDPARQAAEQHWSHARYLHTLMEGEADHRQDRAIQRRLKLARFPVIKTLDQFNWTWPKKINRPQVQNLFRLKFLEDRANVILLGGVGLGKTHPGIALGHAACLKGHSVLFATAVDVINTRAAAHATRRPELEMKKYLKPDLLLIDELGYLPLDKTGADLLFQIISHRYERGSILLTAPTASSSKGLQSSTTTAPSLPPSSIGFCIMPKP